MALLLVLPLCCCCCCCHAWSSLCVLLFVVLGFVSAFDSFIDFVLRVFFFYKLHLLSSVFGSFFGFPTLHFDLIENLQLNICPVQWEWILFLKAMTVCVCVCIHVFVLFEEKTPNMFNTYEIWRMHLHVSKNSNNIVQHNLCEWCQIFDVFRRSLNVSIRNGHCGGNDNCRQYGKITFKCFSYGNQRCTISTTMLYYYTCWSHWIMIFTLRYVPQDLPSTPFQKQTKSIRD